MKKIIMSVLIYLLATAPLITGAFDPQPNNSQGAVIAPSYIYSDTGTIATD